MELKIKPGMKLWREENGGIATTGRGGETGKAELLPYAESQCFPRRGKESNWRRQREHRVHKEEDMKAGMNQERAGGLVHRSPMLG